MEARRGYNPCPSPQTREVTGLGLELRPEGSAPRHGAIKSRSVTGFYLEDRRRLCKPTHRI